MRMQRDAATIDGNRASDSRAKLQQCTGIGRQHILQHEQSIIQAKEWQTAVCVQSCAYNSSGRGSGRGRWCETSGRCEGESTIIRTYSATNDGYITRYFRSFGAILFEEYTSFFDCDPAVVIHWHDCTKAEVRTQSVSQSRENSSWKRKSEPLACTRIYWRPSAALVVVVEIDVGTISLELP
jgi:hypothetical protein